jgi:hypothetical protein
MEPATNASIAATPWVALRIDDLRLMIDDLRGG